MFGLGAHKIIGIDIGSHTLKFVEVNLKFGTSELVSFAVYPTPTGSVLNGEIVNINAIAVAISKAIQDLKTSRVKVATAVAGSGVHIKKISVAPMDKHLIGEHLKWEAEQYIPYPINEVNLAHHVLDLGAHSSETEVLLVAAKKELVARAAECLVLADLECAIVDVSPFALANCYDFNYGISKPNPTILLNIGSSITNFVITYKGQILLCREIYVGGQTYTNEIQKQLGISASEAEILKLDSITSDHPAQEVMSAIETAHEQVCAEIRSTLDFAISSLEYFSLNTCYFTGGGSRTPGLIDKLSQSTDIRFELLNPFNKLKAKSKQLTDNFLQQIQSIGAVGIGLAVRKANKHD